MLTRLLFLALAAVSLASCSRSTAGLTIPPQQTFLLGEYADYDYRASVRNDGPQAVTVALRDKGSETFGEPQTLAPAERTAVVVDARQEVLIANASDRAAELYVVMSRNVTGMRYLEADGSGVEPVRREEGRLTPITPAESVASPREEVSVSLPQNRQYVLGEGEAGGYAAEVTIRGRRSAEIEVAALSRETGLQMQGFGAGWRSTNTVHVRPGEVLYVRNVGAGTAEVRVRFDRPVAGARVTEVE